LLDHFRKKENLRSAETVAAELNSYARKGLTVDALPDLDVRYRPTASLNFYMTKAAIVIQWLRIMERDPSSPKMAREVLDEFERLTFSTLPAEKRLQVVEHIQNLMKLISEINSFMEKRDLPREEVGKRGTAISARWFNLAFDDNDLAIRSSLKHGAELIHCVYAEMEIIGQMTGKAIFERGNI
jgi:hypothetical protein